MNEGGNNIEQHNANGNNIVVNNNADMVLVGIVETLADIVSRQQQLIEKLTKMLNNKQFVCHEEDNELD